MIDKQPPSLSIEKKSLNILFNYPTQSAILARLTNFSSIVFGLMALEFGGSTLLASCEQAYYVGLWGLLYVFGVCVGFLLLGCGFAQKMKAMNVESTIDLFKTFYHSRFIYKSAYILSILTTCGLLTGQIVAAKSLFQALHIKNEAIFILIMISVILYALVGGLKAAGITYNAQLLYTLILFFGIFAFCLYQDPLSFVSCLSTSNMTVDYSFSSLFGSLIMPALYYLTDQEFAQPLLGVTTKRKSYLASACASLAMIFFTLIPIYFGIKAKNLAIDIPAGSNPLIIVLQLLTNEFVVMLAIIGIALGLIAMIDYYLWSISLSITHEVSFLKEKPAHITNKVLLISVGLIGLATAYATTSSAMHILLLSYELYDSCLIVPLLMCYFSANAKKGAAIGSFMMGLFGFIIFRIVPVSFPGHILSLMLSFLGYYAGGWIETLFIKGLRPEHTDFCSADKKLSIKKKLILKA